MARGSSRRLTVEIVGDAESVRRTLGQVQGDLNDAGRAAQSFGDRLQDQGRRLSSFGDTWSKRVTLPIVGGLGAMFAASEQQAQAEARLAGVLRATGEQAGTTAEDIKELAAQQQRLTTFGDEVTVSAAAQLLSFRSIRNELGEGNKVFDRAVVAAQDLSSVFGTDLQSSILQLGKALEDPMTGLTALRRSGISFTEQQREQIRVLVESGKTLEAQKMILDEVERQVGGTAEAMAATAGGRLKQAMNDLGDVAEEWGMVLAPAMAQVAQWGSTVASVLMAIPTPAVAAGTAVLGIAAAMGPVMSISGRVITGLGALADGFSTMRLRAMYAGEGARNLARSMGPMGMAGAAVGATTAIVAVTYAIQEHQKQAAEARARIRGFSDAIRDAGDAAEGTRNRIREMVTDGPEMARWLNQAGLDADDLASALNGTNDEWDAFVDQMLNAARESGMTGPALDLLAQMLGRLRGEAEQAKTDVKDVADATGDAGDAADDAIPGMEGFEDALGGVEDQAVDTRTELEKLNDEYRAMYDPVFALERATRNHRRAVENADEAVKEHGANSAEAAEANWEQLRASVELQGAINSLVDEVENGNVSWEDINRSIDRFVDNGFLAEGQAEELRKKLFELAAFSNINVSLSVDTREAIRRIGEVNRRLEETGGARMASTTVAGGNPYFHGGGVYKAPPGRSEGLAMLRNNEVIFTPEQMKVLGNVMGGSGAAGGANVNVNIDGSGLDPEPIAELAGRKVGWAMTQAGVSN